MNSITTFAILALAAMTWAATPSGELGFLFNIHALVLTAIYLAFNNYRILSESEILEWVAFPFSRGSSQPRDQTQVFHIAGGFFTSWATREPHTMLKSKENLEGIYLDWSDQQSRGKSDLQEDEERLRRKGLRTSCSVPHQISQVSDCPFRNHLCNSETVSPTLPGHAHRISWIPLQFLLQWSEIPAPNLIFFFFGGGRGSGSYFSDFTL